MNTTKHTLIGTQRGHCTICPPGPPGLQQGIALITVLLVLSIATVALVSMSTSRQLDIRRTQNLLRSSQAFAYVYSLETWADTVLGKDKSLNKTDGPTDVWATPLTLTVPQGGQLNARLLDLQGRFNLNNLFEENKPNEREIQRFTRLLALLKLDTDVVDAILDWLDSDSDIRYPNGAEDETYQHKASPYRSANAPFADVSELLLVKGVSNKFFQKLRPYIYVTDSPSKLNINTAAPIILQSLADNLSDDDVRSLSYAIADKPFENVQDFVKHEILAELGVGEEGLGVTSNNFLLTGSISLGKLSLLFDSQFKRPQEGHITLVKRQRRSPVNG